MPEVATPNQGEREFETGSDEFFKAHSELTAANAKRTYDAYQDLDLVAARRSQLQFDQLQNIALQALQNSVETSNMVAKQAIRHADVAADALWTDELNPVTRGAGSNLTAGAVPANRATDVAAAGVGVRAGIPHIREQPFDGPELDSEIARNRLNGDGALHVLGSVLRDLHRVKPPASAAPG